MAAAARAMFVLLVLAGCGSLALLQASAEVAPAPKPANSPPFIQAEARESREHRRVEMWLTEGSRLKGHLTNSLLRLRATAMGEITMPLEQVRSIRATASNAVVESVKGDRIVGQLAGEEWTVAGCLGNIKVPLSLLSRMTIWSAGQVDLQAGLVARWSGEANARDEVGQHHGQALLGVGFIEGMQGQAFHFDGMRSKVNIPDHPAFKPTNSFTIEGWFMFPARTPHGDPTIFFNRGDNRGGLDSYQLAMQADGTLSFTVWDAENRVEQLHTPVPKEQWIHLAAVYRIETGTMEWHVNGERTAKVETTVRPVIELDPNNDPALGIGNHGGQMHQWPSLMLIDELGYFSRDLATDEIQALYQARDPKKARARPPWKTPKRFDEL